LSQVPTVTITGLHKQLIGVDLRSKLAGFTTDEIDVLLDDEPMLCWAAGTRPTIYMLRSSAATRSCGNPGYRAR